MEMVTHITHPAYTKGQRQSHRKYYRDDNRAETEERLKAEKRHLKKLKKRRKRA